MSDQPKPSPAPITDALLDHWFTYHPPFDSHQQVAYESIRSAARQFAATIVRHTPSCADQAAAIRKVREAMMTANASIACGGK